MAEVKDVRMAKKDWALEVVVGRYHGKRDGVPKQTRQEGENRENSMSFDGLM
jgi:hypothetical protein